MVVVTSKPPLALFLLPPHFLSFSLLTTQWALSPIKGVPETRPLLHEGLKSWPTYSHSDAHLLTSIYIILDSRPPTYGSFINPPFILVKYTNCTNLYFLFKFKKKISIFFPKRITSKSIEKLYFEGWTEIRSKMILTTMIQMKL